MRDGNLALVLGEWRERVVVRVVVQLHGQLLEQSAERVTQLLQLLHAVRVEAGLARILDVLGALQHLVEIDRKLTARAEEIHLHDQRADVRRIVDDIPQRRVRHEAAVPVMRAVDLDRRETRWQPTACHDVLRTEAAMLVVEIDRISSMHVDRAHAQADALLVVDPIEVNQLFQRGAKRRGVETLSAPGVPSRARKAGGTRGTKTPGTPKAAAVAALRRLRAMRTGSICAGATIGMPEDTRSQNSRSRSTLLPGA